LQGSAFGRQGFINIKALPGSFYNMSMEINLCSPAQAAAILKKHGIKPKRRLGQNFLVDRNVLNRIVEAAEIGRESVVLEIGAGLGTLSQALAEKAKMLVAVETDRQLIPILEETLSGIDNVEITAADFTRLELESFLSEKFGDERCIVAANLPYYITTPVITALIDARRHIERMVLMVQKEVADRLAAKPGSDDYGALSVLVQFYSKVQIVMKVSRNVFMPAPEVDSAVVRMDVPAEPAVKVRDEKLFFEIVRSAFEQRRKTLLRALINSRTLGWDQEKVAAVLSDARIEGSRRGETLSIEEFARLADSAWRAKK